MADTSAFHFTEAIAQFDQSAARHDGAAVVPSLYAGLDCLAALLLDRVAQETAGRFGLDSMIVPTALIRGHVLASVECELYQAAEAATATTRLGLLSSNADWFPPWLARLRLHDRWDEPGAVARLAAYRAKRHDSRGLAFETALERVLPQTTQAPLVLFRLYPLAIELVTAVAFAAGGAAEAARHRQRELLPSLADCHDCRGRVLDNGEECRQCGNPLWHFAWLTAE